MSLGAELPYRPRRAADDNPSWPEEHENQRIAHAENEEGELVEELLPQHLHGLGVPDSRHESSRHDVAVKGA